MFIKFYLKFSAINYTNSALAGRYMLKNVLLKKNVNDTEHGKDAPSDDFVRQKSEQAGWHNNSGRQTRTHQLLTLKERSDND